MAGDCPHTPAREHTPGATPAQLARVASKSCTNTLPTSALTHSSNTPQAKSPHRAASTDSGVSLPPSSQPGTESGDASSRVRSTTGVNCR